MSDNSNRPLEDSIIETPSLDNRRYKHIVIGTNKSGDDASQQHLSMDVLLISDPETDKASAAMDIYVGQLCDTLPGIAHFCEHMLFIGTSKYPTENAYDHYLSTHGGSSNAFTDLEHTCYYFDVQAESLEGALDRFAQCFISPLFTQSALDREVQAVDSEHAKNVMQDQWRMYQLSKSKMATSDHPYSGFGSGNAQSLDSKSIRETLLAFFEQNYRKSLQLYKLVVLGKESLEELQNMVERYFGELVETFENEDDAAGSSVPKPSRDEILHQLYHPPKWQVPQRLHVVPVSQVHALELQFPMREILSLYKSKPTRYLSHLVGHEGTGSLLSLLKSKQYVTELYADDSSKSCIPWSIFTIRMELTDAGLEHVDDIISLVFAYIDLLKSKGPQEWIHEEVTTVGDLQFRFLSQRNPMDYTCSIAGWMQQFPPSMYLSGAYKICDWNADQVQECLASLTPDNMFVMVSSPTFGEGDNCVEEEKWYGTKYCNMDCDEETWNKWKAVSHEDYQELQLPEINDMIATNFDLLEGKSDETKYPKDQPQCIHQDNNICLWYKPDNVFDMPKVNIMYSFKSGRGPFSPDAMVSAHLFAELVQEQCNEFSYLASMAGLHCDISPSASGMEMHISGYNHKAHVLVERLVDAMMDLFSDKKEMDAAVFDRISFKVAQQYHSFLVSQPYHHAIYGGDLVLEAGKVTIQDKIKVLQNITLEDVLAFAKGFWKYCHMEGLIHGNMSAQQAYDITNTVWKKTHPSHPNTTEAIITRAALDKRVVDLSASSSGYADTSSSFLYRFPEFNDANSNSCVQIVLQMGALDMATNSNLAFVNHLVREPAFNQLRTEEQLGYIVHTSVKTSGDNIKGLVFLIQSDSFDPNHVESRIEEFLAAFRQRIVAMSSDDFQTNVDSVVASFLEKNKNLGEESSRYWHVITNKTYQFRRLQMMADLVKTLKKEQVIQFFDKYVAANGSCRHKLCIQVVAKQHANAAACDDKEQKGVVLIENPADFKLSMPLFAMPSKVVIPPVDMGIVRE
ncbi:secreted/periplasmic Zn-dependent peptidase, insulinase-like protein [Nitzschia inconspicua]|uniref:Secreted/periplasmic Zn-dependent peptidase, insulinase-like protein n=1 Tax=Nitzschia inconspicua TaxID=303405 RepID=A0A9K3LZF1_9STRA|nr:secreted/periplasmic Zn-dependent peptidase, insulinase-like protein [Nitzschia inconspicua]